MGIRFCLKSIVNIDFILYSLRIPILGVRATELNCNTVRLPVALFLSINISLE